ncbi:MAG: hypothetical protein IJT37_06080 [Lachnospiraceae bacterium]|nr:hypothetical protein [Lachnospiraceae bacterium]
MNKVSEDVMKRRSFISVVIVFIFSMTLLVGCGEWTQYFYSKAHCEKIAKKCLKEYFGEEFEIKGIYSQYWKQFYAYCSPVRDKDIIFEAKFSRSGYIIYDYYLEGVIAKQIEERLYNTLNSIWEDVYIAVDIGRDKGTKALEDNPKCITLEDYMKLREENGVALVYLFVPENDFTISDENNEYQIFANSIGTLIENNIIPRIGIYMGVVNENQMIRIKEYWSSHTHDKSNMDKIVNSHMFFNFEKESLKLSISKEEYLIMREEVLKNGAE